MNIKVRVSHAEFISASFNVTAINKMQVELNNPALRDPEQVQDDRLDVNVRQSF